MERTNDGEAAKMMLRAVSLALIVGSSAAAASDETAGATCSASSFQVGHDFKNMQYAHVPGTSAADW